MELKLLALTIFVLILIFFNYRRYKRLERQRALLRQARSGLFFETTTTPFRRSINITTRNPRHQIAIIFPGNGEFRTEANNNAPDLPPSYYDLFSEADLSKGVLPSYGQVSEGRSQTTQTGSTGTLATAATTQTTMNSVERY